MWQKTDMLGGLTHYLNTYTWSDPSDGDGTDPDGTLFTEFLAQMNNCVANLQTPENVTGGFAGYCDWRIPQIHELGTIHSDSTQLYCINPAVFGPVAGTDDYWSATTVSTDPTLAHHIDIESSSFGCPLDSVQSKDSVDAALELFHGRAVRTGVCPRFVAIILPPDGLNSE